MNHSSDDAAFLSHPGRTIMRVTSDEIISIITALTALVGAVTAVIVAIKQAGIGKTVNETNRLTNGHNTALRALVEKQGLQMHEAGLPPTTDDSLTGGEPPVIS